MSADRDFVTGYLEALLFASTDFDGEPLDKRFTVNDLPLATIRLCQADCGRFMNEAALVGLDGAIRGREREAGIDFFLTREGHGAGFWDGDWDDGDALSDIARAFGPADPYVGDSGRVYVSEYGACITRARYLAGDIDHAAYYNHLAKSLGILVQPDNPFLLDRVIPALLAGDEDLNTIPLSEWELRANRTRACLKAAWKRVAKQAGETDSPAVWVCIFKQAFTDAAGKVLAKREREAERGRQRLAVQPGLD